MNKITNSFLRTNFSVVGKIFVVFLCFFGIHSVDAQVVVQTVTTTGSGTFIPPAGVTTIQVEAWGAGGRGGQRSNNGRGGGGGGGAYSRGIVSVIPGGTYYINVGAGSTTTAVGGSSWFNGLNNVPTSNDYVLAVGGNSAPNNSNNGATGGDDANGYGNVIRYSGGNGANSTGSITGGGGSSAGTGVNGNNANNGTGGAAPVGGGAGANGHNNQNTNGNPGLAPGGGGSGARRSNNTRLGGAGARGQIRISHLPVITGNTNLSVNDTSTLANSVSGGTWSSSNPVVATVNPTTGLVTAIATGTIVITYTTPDGLSRFVVVTVDDGGGVALCASQGRDGTTVTTYGAGHINTYYPGGASVSAGATSVSVGAVPSGYGATPIAAGDLLIIMQMQRAAINTTDTSSYGLISDGYTTGHYEYVVAQNNVPVGGGTLNFRGSAISGGLRYNYITFDGNSDTNRGKGRYQIIRVPQYSSITLTQNLTTPHWSGDVGGVIAMEVSGTLNFNGYTIHADNRGFRGGFSPNTTSGDNLTHYRSLNTDNLGAGKGEGIAGTPRYVWNVTSGVSLDNGNGYQGGYSNGDFSRGAPANGGGGGNSHNSGAGGGSNSGAGGRGGFGYRGGWNANSHTNASTIDDRGIGGYSLSSIGAGVINNVSHRVFMGGGGGRGDANNNNTSFGGTGGGIVLVSARNVIGTGTLRANGSNGGAATDDGAGGGGAGGTVFLNVANISAGTISLIANGGAGGAVTHTDIHGPGGGGGGGAIFYHIPGATVNTTANGGASGTQSHWTNHGASAGTGGSVVNFTEIPVSLDRFRARCYVITNPMIRQKVKR